MRLTKARVQKYRSIRDTGPFDIDVKKTIIVGANEAGKSALLQALQQINPPPDVKKFDALRDYPRSEYNDISTGKVKPSEVIVATGWFLPDSSDTADVAAEFKNAIYVVRRHLDNSLTHYLESAPSTPTYQSIKNDLLRLVAHADARVCRKHSAG